MLRRTPLRLGAATATLLVAALAAGPAFAASQVTGSATALRITVAGKGASSGAYIATRTDGRESTRGSRSPAIPAPGVGSIRSGVLTQDAITNERGTLLRATACSGLADSGSALSAGGKGATCTKAGPPISIGGGTVDLTKLAPTGLSDTLKTAILAAVASRPTPPVLADGVVDTLVAGLAPMLVADFAKLDTAQVDLSLKAIEGRCTAIPGEATGGARINDVGLVISFPAATGVQPITQSFLPANPKPNTVVTRNLSQVGDLIETSLRESVKQFLATNDADGNASQLLAQALKLAGGAGNASPLGQALTKLAAPLDQNLLSFTLNRQTRPADGSIRATALVLDVLPAAEQVITDPLGRLEVGDTTCTAGAKAAATTTTTTTAVPTRIDSGTSGSSGSGPAGAVLLLGGLVLLAGAGAGVGVRRIRR